MLSVSLIRGVIATPCEGYTLVWPNGADFDPATLHDWPEVESAFTELARSWRSPSQA